MTNIKILQGLVRPEQFAAIIDWNRARNNLEHKDGLEFNMLKEEAEEYFEATQLVDKLDAIDDFLFVGVGSEAKAAANLIEAPVFINQLETILSDFAGRCIAYGIDISFVGELISNGLDIVIEANQQKLAEKSAEGKIQKPEGFIPPEESLQGLLDAFKEREVQPQMPQGMPPQFTQGQ